MFLAFGSCYRDDPQNIKMLLLAIVPIVYLVSSAATQEYTEILCMDLPLYSKRMDFFMRTCDKVALFPLMINVKTWEMAALNYENKNVTNFDPIKFIHHTPLQPYTKNMFESDARRYKEGLKRNTTFSPLVKLYMYQVEFLNKGHMNKQISLLASVLKGLKQDFSVSGVVIIPEGHKKNMIPDCAKLSQALRGHMKRLGLSVYFSAPLTVPSDLNDEDVSILSNNTDYLILRTAHLNQAGVTSLDSPLGGQYENTIESIVDSWTKSSYPNERLLGTITLSGIQYTLEDESKFSMGDPTIGNMTALYRQYCRDLRLQDWSWSYLDVEQSVYGHRSIKWVTIPTVKTVFEKAEYLRRNNIKNLLLLNMKSDTEKLNSCPAGDFPLIKAAFASKAKINGLIMKEGASFT